MQQRPLEAADVWQKQANKDLETAGILEQLNPTVACFLAEQSTEKALESLFVVHGVDFRRIHSTRELIGETSDWYPQLLEFLDSATHLDDYYIGTRYPALDAIEAPCERYSPTHAADAIQKAEKIVEACKAIYQEVETAVAQQQKQKSSNQRFAP